MGHKTMFTERELLIMSFAIDKIVKTTDGNFFSKSEADLLCHKIHNVLQATRKLAMGE
jgi:hypothetical protein